MPKAVAWDQPGRIEYKENKTFDYDSCSQCTVKNNEKPENSELIAQNYKYKIFFVDYIAFDNHSRLPTFSLFDA